MAKKRAPRSPSRLRTVQCHACQSPFETRHSQGRFCSADCARQGERKSWREYGERNRDRRRIYHRTHYVETAEHVLARTAAYAQTPSGREAKATAQQNQKLRAPEKIAARYAVKVALQRGLLIRHPCERCGEGPTEAHHPDYSRPLDIIWLCQPCHQIEHGRVPRAGRTTPLATEAAE